MAPRRTLSHRPTRRKRTGAPLRPATTCRTDLDHDLAAVLPVGLRQELPDLPLDVLFTGYSLARHGHRAPHLARYLQIPLADAFVITVYASDAPPGRG